MSNFQKNVKHLLKPLKWILLQFLADLNHASQKGYKPSLIAQLVVQRLITHSVVATKSHQLEASVQKLPVQHGVTQLRLSWRKVPTHM